MLYELDPTGAPSGVMDLNQLLIASAESLDIPPSRHKEATDSYEAVGRWLADPKSPLAVYRPEIYPQGSFALGTAVKPIGRDEFDIDVTCVLTIPPSIGQRQLKNMVGDRLKAHEFYSPPVLEEKTKCWRLNYAGQFHLDIVPSKPAELKITPTSLLITDRDYSAWKPTDPKGYIGWFEIKKRISTKQFVSAMNASVEPAPMPEEQRRKTPLQIAIQLLKRHRDVMFQNRDDAPISIIITTLAGHAYQQEASVFATMRGLIRRMPEKIEWRDNKPYVVNPTNPLENFADKWHTHPGRKAAFDAWIRQADRDLGSLEAARGLQNVAPALAKFLGEKRASQVLRGLADTANKARVSGLKVNLVNGLLGSVGATVPGNTFFGD